MSYNSQYGYKKQVTRLMKGSSQLLAILMGKLRSSLGGAWEEPRRSLGAVWSEARVWLEGGYKEAIRRLEGGYSEAKGCLERYFCPLTANILPSLSEKASLSQREGFSLIAKSHFAIFVFLMLILGSGNVWGQSPVEITSDTNENGTIEDSEKKFYLIQTNAFPSFYIAPLANNTITTNNILGDYMLWYFLDAGEDGGTQYYYIVNNSTGKYIYNHNGNSRGINITDFAALSDANKEKCKFKLVVDNSGGTTGFYNIDVKASQTYYGLNKQNGSQANDNPIRLTNDQYIHDTNSKWKFVAFNGTFTYPTPPFTPSTDSDKHYYEIHNIQKDTYYAATDATPDKVIFTNQANESRAWYFKEAASDTWYKYYYIINPATGGEYMYYNGTADNTGDQTKAIDVKAYDSENEDRYQFVVVLAARGDGSSRVTCYAIIPKLLIDNLWTSSSIGYAQGSITNGLNMGIINSRGATNGAHWEFKTTTFSTVCDHPVIAFDRTTGKASITTATLLPSIYYTTDETTPSSTNGTLYNGAFTLTEPTTVKAIVTKAGYTDSEVTTLTIGKVATPTIQQETGTHNVSITTETPGATIYYTIDGTTPTTSSTLYTGASEELGGKHIKAIAVKDNMINSDIGEGEIDIRCATPIISFNNITSTVSITCGTEGSTIHYTIDNSEPTTTSTAYTGPFSVTSPTTVKSIATHGDLDPSVVAELVIPQVATPTIQNNGSNAVSITTETVGATIYYTTDGSTPTTSSTQYTVPLTENISGVTIKAIAVKEGMVTSAVGSNAVILQCAAPDIARSGNDGFTISCSFPASGVTIYYTTNGTTPTTSSSSISPGAIVSSTLPVTVNAMAVAANYDNSDVSTATLKEGMDGDGSVGNPYTIKYQPDVEDFIDHVNTAEGASLHYKVIATNPLDFSSAAPITQAFSGTFDGGTQPITGLTHPLFNTVDGGVVKNVTLKNVGISSSEDYVGAIAGIAQGYSRIYNCGILPNDATFPEGTHPFVNGGTCAGGIVGKLDGDSRVINCYSYADVSASTTAAGIVGENTFASTAEVSGGKYTKLRTAVVNCMFYGNITGGTNQHGVYGGSLITNAAATGISSYNYYRSGSTFTTGEPTAYNCSFPADERYLTQVEFHRSLLNSNRELCGWWVGSDVAPSTLTTTEVQAIPKDATLMYKWVVDPNLAPYPILKPFGKYPSIINTNTGTPWFDRNTANPFEGKQLGTLSVIIKSGGSASDQHLNIPITDMDSLHYDFGYRKIQLPYYNTVFGNPDGATWQEKYAGNYTDQVVTGWKVTNVSGGNEGSFVAHWQDGYNFADRNCTQKDLYSVSGRVFAQGGYYYVPDDVTEITIEAYWGKAIYVRNKDSYYDRVNVTSGNTGAAFAPTGTRDNNVNGATIQTTSIKETLTAANIDAKKTVYDYALVLVGNVQESVGKSDVVHKTQDTRGFTIMSVDLDFDEEPDYCLEWQLGANMTRQVIAPIRFDFLPVVELGIAGKLHNSQDFYSLGCYRSKGHFEVTETAFIRFGQFEFELGTRDDGPIILNGGIYDQYSRGRNGETNQHINYVILGGHIVMPSFTPGAHVNSAAKYQTRHCAVNVLGGDFTSFYLTGGYNEAIEPFEDNPHCYIDGGRFGTIAAAYKEGIWGDVTWRINHALIGEFYGGGVMAQATGTTYKIVKGSIDVVINNSIVGKYCGGPKFGDMVSGKTVKTSATGTTFNQFFGAGNGGTNYVQYANTDGTGVPVTDWSSTINTNYTPGKYRNKDQGYAANYDLEVINYSTGDGNGKFVNRSYYYSAQFATTNTGNVTSTLTDCTINTNFYGGGFLGGVTGNVTSTLNNCTVNGAVFGAGYSASAGTVNIYNKDKVPPVPNTYTGMIKPQTGGTFTTYEWTNNKTFGTKTLSTGSPTILNPNDDGKNYIYTEVSLQNLGAVSGNVILTINGKTVGESVYGGGEESVVNGNTTVTVTGGTIGTTGKGGARWGNVLGGGKGKADDVNAGLVKGNTTINISQAENQTTTIIHNVYGGGAFGSVGTFTYDGTTGLPNGLTANTGTANITITGGTFGSDGKENGMIFGSSRGSEGDPAADTNIDKIAWVGNTNVVIGTTSAESNANPAIKGSVYGGGENGHNYQDAHVTIHSGTIGVTDPQIDGGARYPTRGNVYGGGCGTDTFERGEGDDKKTYYNFNAGIVLGNTQIDIDGGHIVHNVYGGGAMGSVGTYTLDADGTNDIQDGMPISCAANTGLCTINITGGKIGMTNVTMQGHGTDGPDDLGHVFGAGRGYSKDPNVYPNIETCAFFNNTNLTIGGTALVCGSVYGGSESGHVLYNTNVTISGGQIGCGVGRTTAYTDDDFNTTSLPGTAHWTNNANGAPYDQYASSEGTYDYTGDFAYIPEADRKASSEGGRPVATDGRTFYGNVFAGGSGYYPYAPGLWLKSAGHIGGTATVTVTGGHILNNLYGGCEMADIDGAVTVTMTGGTVGVPRTKEDITTNPNYGNVYGAGMGDKRIFFNTSTNVASTTVNISNGTIYGSVFGGGEDGHVMGSATTTISEPEGKHTVIGCDGQSGNDGNVFGAGQGHVGALTAGVVGGNASLTITGGTMKGSVYGGGRIASVGTYFAMADDPNYGKMQEGDHGNLTVSLTGGDILRNVYGGCMGTESDVAYGISKNVSVELNKDVDDAVKGCIVRGPIFGCNNVNSSPEGTSTVHIYKTQRWNADRITNTSEITNAKVKGTKDSEGEFVLSSFDVPAVYGGGNLAAYTPKAENGSTNVIIDGCERTSVGQVYGGGNAASTPATSVTVNGTFEIGELFGGGNGKDALPSGDPNPGANVGFKDYYAVENDERWNTKEKRETNQEFIDTYVYGTGLANVDIKGGTIHRVFGGSNTKGNVRETALTMLEEVTDGGAPICDFHVDEAYGGGKSAPMDAEAKLLMACIPGLEEVYGGAQAADIHDDVTLTITNGTFNRVFGGNNLSGTIDGSITVNVEEVGCRPIIIGELYGGGNLAAYSIYGYKDDGTPKTTGENPSKDPEINVKSFTSIGSIYGGGYGEPALMVGSPTVNINEVADPESEAQNKSYVEDAQTKYYSDYPGETKTIAEHSVILPSHSKGKMGSIYNVFGGGNAAKVMGSTTVNIGTTVGNEIYIEIPVKVGATLPADCYTKSGDEYTSVSGPAEEGKEYYKKYIVLGVDIRDNIYGGGNNAEVTGNTNVNIGKKVE